MISIDTTQACILRGAVIGCIAFALATPVVQAQGAYDGVVVFGTSLSDTGNAFVLWGEASTAPDYQLDPLLVPSAPYARGGHHFTNGRTWVEQLAGSLGHAGSVRPAFRAEGPVATNYAVAAARARDDGKNFNLTAQVDAFLEASGGIASPNALYVIEMGGNDIRDALVAYPNGHTLVIKEALQAIAVNVGRLYGAGARQFLIWRAPNPALTPAIRYLNSVMPGTAQLVTGLTMAFNGGLDGIVAQWTPAPEIHIARLDAFALLNEVVLSPETFDLTNVTAACITPGTAPFACVTPDEYLFWDGIHPTTAMHGFIAKRAAEALGQ
ncbi:Phosphatidylcholine-sterol acyltransferase precursor [Luteitalea pratensis]|uniref:Phosphatidylcholine-sterol acyltransferase n=1 Tax=Luteitalea pratensis TaxID=1855912 RepID=A0A143PVM5_LUTPR|nr:SGNH/GDSL hydrolase family protein [Luteitalea pratensis]AMY12110.1 Phosphatidylcholine-sterol acyltransferase precursor [Luteitalea pratensis]